MISKNLNLIKLIKSKKNFVTCQREWLKRLFKEIFSEIMDSNLDRSGLINLKSFELEYKNIHNSELGIFLFKITIETMFIKFKIYESII